MHDKAVQFLFLAFCFLLSSCGYRMGQGELSSQYSTITVPYVEGDLDGTFTNALVKHLATAGGFEYQADCAALVLKVKLLELRDENIGFRYDRHRNGRLRHNIIPTETRIIVSAEMCVFEAATGRTILGPAIIVASVDFDHDYYSSRGEVNVFSLGQLTDIDEAEDAVRRPLSQALAAKIVAYVNASW